MNLSGNDPPWCDSAHPPLRMWTHGGIVCAIGDWGGCALDGFANVPESHPWHRFTDYRDIPVVVHGGLTHGPHPPQGVAAPLPAEPWDPTAGWIGFSTDHAGDLWPEAELAAIGIGRHETFDELRHLQRKINQATPESLWTTWTLAELVAEDEHLAEQVADAWS
jgi:hypothetical protein